MFTYKGGNVWGFYLNGKKENLKASNMIQTNPLGRSEPNDFLTVERRMICINPWEERRDAGSVTRRGVEGEQEVKSFREIFWCRWIVRGQTIWSAWKM